MGGIFSRPKPPPPPPSRLEESIVRQEKREAQKEVDVTRKVAARAKAKRQSTGRFGGRRNLMAPGVVNVTGRDTASTAGLQSTLGAGRNPRG